MCNLPCTRISTHPCSRNRSVRSDQVSSTKDAGCCFLSPSRSNAQGTGDHLNTHAWKLCAFANRCRHQAPLPDVHRHGGKRRASLARSPIGPSCPSWTTGSEGSSNAWWRTMLRYLCGRVMRRRSFSKRASLSMTYRRVIELYAHILVPGPIWKLEVLVK